MKLRLVVYLALLLAVAGAAAAQAASQHHRSADFAYAAEVDNGLWVLDQDMANQRALLIAHAGFNSVRIFVPYSPGQAEIKNDQVRLCVAAKAAQAAELKLIITIYGVRRDGRPGYMPESSTGITQFIKTVDDYLYWQFGENGCTPDVHDFVFEIMNEVNTPQFMNRQYDSVGNWIAPTKYVQLMARVYPVLKSKAAKLGVNLTVVGAGLAASHNPLGFIAGMAQAMAYLKESGPLFDWFSFHPYPGGQLGLADYPLLRSALNKAFDWQPPLLYSEYGIESRIPQSQQYRYDIQANPNAVSEAQQAAAYIQAFGLASQQDGVVGLALFHMFDDPFKKDWQSGLYYFDPFYQPSDWVAKTSLLPVCQTVSAIDNKDPNHCRRQAPD